MKHTPMPLYVLLIIAIAVSSCTTKQVYTSGQAWQHNECHKIIDRAEHERCLNSTSTSYEDYKRKMEDIKQQ